MKPRLNKSQLRACFNNLFIACSLLLLALLVLPSKALVNDGLVLHLSAQNINGLGNSADSSDTELTWTDLSGNNNHGTLAASVTTDWDGTNVVSDPSLLEMDGANDQTTIANESNFDFIDIGNNFSIEIWFKTNRADSYILSKHDGTTGIDLGIKGSGNAELELTTPNGNFLVDAGVAVNDNKWHQLIVIADNNLLAGRNKTQVIMTGGLRFFVDGRIANYDGNFVDTVPTGSMANNASLILGNSASGVYTNRFSGEIAYVRVYNQALSYTQGLDNYRTNKEAIYGLPDTPYITSAIVNGRSVPLIDNYFGLYPGDTLKVTFESTYAKEPGTNISLVTGLAPNLGTLTYGASANTVSGSYTLLSSQSVNGLTVPNQTDTLAVTALTADPFPAPSALVIIPSYSAPQVPIISSALINGAPVSVSHNYRVELGSSLELQIESDGAMGAMSAVSLSTPSVPTVGTFTAAAAADPGRATYTFTPSISDVGRTYSFSVTASDGGIIPWPSNGNLDITITVPLPAIPLPLPPEISPSIASNDVISTKTNLSGTASPNSTIEVSLGDKELGIASTGSNGEWDLKISDKILGLLDLGQNSISILARDSSNIASSPITIDLYKVGKLSDKLELPRVPQTLNSNVCQAKSDTVKENEILAGSLLSLSIENDQRIAQSLFDNFAEDNEYSLKLLDVEEGEHSIPINIERLSESKLLLKSKEAISKDIADGAGVLTLYEALIPILEIDVTVLNKTVESSGLQIDTLSISSVSAIRKAGKLNLIVKSKNLNLEEDLLISKKLLEKKDCRLPLTVISAGLNLEKMKLKKSGKIVASYAIPEELDNQELDLEIVLSDTGLAKHREAKVAVCEDKKCRSEL